MAMKKRMTSTPHDAVFKRFLRHPETATDFLTLYLPEAIRQRCDFSTLRLQSASFIDEDLRACIQMSSGRCRPPAARGMFTW